MKRGDVVVVPFPFQDRPGKKSVPRLSFERRRNQWLVNTILAMITGNLTDAGQTPAVLVDPSTPDGLGSGLVGPSLVKCYNLATVRQRAIQVIRHLSPALMLRVDACLKASLALP